MARDRQVGHADGTDRRRVAMRLSDLKRLIAPVSLPKPLQMPRLEAAS
ncbi:MAG: hypothetical protein JXR75_10500 [Rhodobacteraceae bacterium]|nr:hypothetical protein [Paracoccaceae bacterium]